MVLMAIGDIRNSGIRIHCLKMSLTVGLCLNRGSVTKTLLGTRGVGVVSAMSTVLGIAVEVMNGVSATSTV